MKITRLRPTLFVKTSHRSGNTLTAAVMIIATVVLATGNPQKPMQSDRPRSMSEDEFRRQFKQNAYVERLGLECNPKPTQDEVNTAELGYSDLYLSAKRAASLGVPIVNASAESDYLVIVRDYRRFKACTATDGKTTLHYGNVIRAVIELTDYKAGVNLTLATIAANATISGKQQYFYLYKSGWFNPKADTILATVSGKVFDVENYGLYQAVMPQLIGLFSEGVTVFAPSQILRIAPGDDPAFVMASARAYAFAQAKSGKSCQEASQKFSTDPARAAAVVDAYAFLGKPSCTNEKIVEPEKSRAATLLGGIKVN